MTSKKGSKLHSIIEKLSEQFVRENQTDDSTTEEDLDIVTVTMQPPQQRKSSRNAKATTRNKRQKRQKRSSKAKKAKPRPALKRKSVDNEKKLSGKQRVTSENYQPVDEDLCIDVNAVINAVPQMEDIDTANVHIAYNSPLKKNVCRVCFQQLKSREELLEHVRQCRPVAFKKLPVYTSNDQDNDTIEASAKQSEEQGQEEDEDEDEDIDVEGIEESDDDNHHGADPDFDVDVGDVSDASSEDVTVPAFKQKRRSARIRAMKVSKETKSNQLEESPKHPTDNQDDCDIHIDVAKIINTKPTIQNIELPTTKEIACKHCEEMFYFKMELENHVEERHPESADTSIGQGIATCEHCGREFLTRKGLFLHIRKLVHKIERGEKTEEETRKRRELERTCRECGKVFKDFGSLKEHYVIHSDASPFKCDLCDKTFKDKNYVYRHMQIHTGAKRYECKHCKKLFAHSGSLRSHIMLHTGERPFKCQFCETGFISRFELRVHENRHTGNMPFKCPHCPKGFPKSNNLKMHLTSHSNDKPFHCEVCGKGFKRQDHLRYHRYIHLENKPYKCNTCNKTFSQHVCLRKHLPCRELEKLEKRANKPKENSSKKQKVAKNSLKDKLQVSESGNNTNSTTTVATNQEREQNMNTSDRAEKEDDAVSPQEVTSRNTDSAAAKKQHKTNKTKANQGKEQTQSKDKDESSSPCIADSILSAQNQSYVAESHYTASDDANPVQNIDTDLALATLMEKDCSTNTLPHCSMDKVDFNHEYRNSRHGTSTPSVRTLAPAERLPDTCVCTSSIQAFVPFHCSSQGAPGMEYGGGLDLETIPSVGSHGNILGNRSYVQETQNDLSSALLAAMDPDNLSSMVGNSTTFFPQT